MELDTFDVVLFDLDGTIYYGSKIIPGANETIEFFRKAGKKIYFTTNNSTKTRAQIYDKLFDMGVNCKLDEVLTSGYIAAIYCKKNKLNNVYIFGSSNLIQEFNELGITVNQNDDAENLLIGYNPLMTYDDLTAALQVALHAKQIMACNRERTFPGENSKLMPGCGAMTAPIEWCTQRECDLIIGKPNTLMIDLLCDFEKLSPDRFLIIGDTYESDIRMADRAGCKSILIDKENLYKNCLNVNDISIIPGVFN
ncbi:HAD-hyrolase-like [Treponema bryantii]|uniref:HAD-hyrolase-like n=1 Tax=Treponema bryantii TaxID=163 RepID=A0A1I3IWP0_9SPIR|nr:HAD-IIA family hydrolase [Treponema bryantii]SFI52379.1 HAD-hyrolase-like [Treponema bryantii]